MDNFQKSHAGEGIHFHSGTSVSTVGTYYGFQVTEETVVADISITTPTLTTGDYTAHTLPAGLYVAIAGGFTDITLTSGAVILLKEKL